MTGVVGVLIPFPRVTDSRTQNLVFRRPCSFLWFSIVSYNNYGGDSKLYFYKFYIFGSSSFRDFGCDTQEHAISVNGTYFCPCVRCLNQIRHDLDIMRDHLFIFSIMRSYTL